MKKIFLNNWFYYFAAIILFPLSILGPAFTIVLYCYLKGVGNSTIDGLIYFIIFVTPLSLYSGFLVCKNFMQWTIIDNQAISNKNIFGIIRKVNWHDVISIQEVDSNFSTIGTKLKWICFYDEKDGIKESNGIGRSNSYIMIRNTKKNKEIVEYYWKDSISDN